MLLSVAPKMKRRKAGDASAGMRRQRPRSGAVRRPRAAVTRTGAVRRPAAECQAGRPSRRSSAGSSSGSSSTGRSISGSAVERPVSSSSDCLGTRSAGPSSALDVDPAEVQRSRAPRAIAVRVPDEHDRQPVGSIRRWAVAQDVVRGHGLDPLAVLRQLLVGQPVDGEAGERAEDRARASRSGSGTRRRGKSRAAASSASVTAPVADPVELGEHVLRWRAWSPRR